MGTDLVDEFLGTGRTTHRTVLIVLRPGERYERVACRRDKRATRNRGPMRISAIGPLAVGSSLGCGGSRLGCGPLCRGCAGVGAQEAAGALAAEHFGGLAVEEHRTAADPPLADPICFPDRKNTQGGWAGDSTRRSLSSWVVLCGCRFGSGGGFEGDAVAHRHQLRDVVACSAFGVDPGCVVVGAEVAEPGGGVVEHVPDDDQDGAGDRDQGFELAAAFDDATRR